MEEKDYYFACFIILIVAFVIVLGFALIFNVTTLSKTFSKEDNLRTTTKTTTTRRTTRTTSDEEETVKAKVSVITKINGARDYTIEITNNTEENYYLSNNGNREITLYFQDDVEKIEVLNSETSCITPNHINAKSYSFNSSSCTETSSISLSATYNGITKNIIITNEEDLTLSYEGNILKNHVEFSEGIIELNTNIPVEWVTSDKNGLIYTDISNNNIQFKLTNDNMTLKAVTKGGQEIEVVFE